MTTRLEKVMLDLKNNINIENAQRSKSALDLADIVDGDVDLLITLFCPSDFGLYCSDCEHVKRCRECWNRPIAKGEE